MIDVIEDAVDAVDARIFVQTLRQMLDDIEATNADRVVIRLVQFRAAPPSKSVLGRPTDRWSFQGFGTHIPYDPHAGYSRM